MGRNGSLGTVVGLLVLVTLGVGAGRTADAAEERQRRNIFGIHNLNYGQFRLESFPGLRHGSKEPFRHTSEE